MLNVPGATAGAAFGELHELVAPPGCSFPVCVWTNGPVLAIENPVIEEIGVAAMAGPAPTSAKAVTARTARALTTRLRLQGELGARPERQAAHLGAVHDLIGVQLLALGEPLAHSLRKRQAELGRLAGAHGERLRSERRLPQLARVRPGATDEGRRGAGEAQRDHALPSDDLRESVERDSRVGRRIWRWRWR